MSQGLKISQMPLSEVTPNTSIPALANGKNVRIAPDSLIEASVSASLVSRFESIVGPDGAYDPAAAPLKSKPFRIGSQWLAPDEAARRISGRVDAIDPTGDPEAVDPDDLTATALRKTEQALTADERAQVLANLGDPQWTVFDTMWLAAGDVNGEQVTTVDHSRAKPYVCLGVELTAAEAVEAYAYYRPTEPQELTRGYGNARARVLLPVRLGDDQAVTPMMFFGAAQLEALCITRANGAVPTLTYWSQLFDGCQKLRRIEGVLAMGSRCTTANMAFRNCYALEEVRITGLCVSIDFGRSAKLSVYSVAYMVDAAANTDAITITLHADVFAQLPPPLITLATAKNITLASA